MTMRALHAGVIASLTLAGAARAASPVPSSTRMTVTAQVVRSIVVPDVRSLGGERFVRALIASGGEAVVDQRGAAIALVVRYPATASPGAFWVTMMADGAVEAPAALRDASPGDAAKPLEPG